MRTLLNLLIIGSIVLLSAVPADAGLGFLVPSVVNKLEDTDFETLINNDGNGNYSLLTPQDSIVDVGDVLAGLVRIQAQYIDDGTNTYQEQQGPAFGTNPPPGPTFTGVFVTAITGKSGNDTDGFTFELGIAPDAAWTFLDLSRNSSSTMLRLFDDSSSPFIDPTEPVTGVAATDLANLQAALATSDGTLAWEFGDLGGNFFWEAQTNTDDALLVNTGAQTGFQAALDVTSQGAGPLLDPHDTLADLGFTTQGDTQLQLQGTFESVSGLNILPVQTDADLYILPNVIPEPFSLLVWGGLISLTYAFAGRRRD